MPTSFVIVWRYRVAPDHRADFEAAYGPSGPWARLFGRSPSYIGTDLVAGVDGDYLTIDRWDAEAHAVSFLVANREEYDRIDRACAEWTEVEDLIFRGGSLF